MELNKIVLERYDDFCAYISEIGGVIVPPDPTQNIILKFIVDDRYCVIGAKKINEEAKNVIIDFCDPAVRKNKDTKRKRSSKKNKRLKQLLGFLYGEKCVICQSTEKLTLEHFYPQRIKSITDINNCFLLCQACNFELGAEPAQKKIIRMLEMAQR